MSIIYHCIPFVVRQSAWKWRSCWIILYKFFNNASLQTKRWSNETNEIYVWRASKYQVPSRLLTTDCRWCMWLWMKTTLIPYYKYIGLMALHICLTKLTQISTTSLSMPMVKILICYWMKWMANGKEKRTHTQRICCVNDRLQNLCMDIVCHPQNTFIHIEVICKEQNPFMIPLSMLMHSNDIWYNKGGKKN